MPREIALGGICVPALLVSKTVRLYANCPDVAGRQNAAFLRFFSGFLGISRAYRTSQDIRGSLRIWDG